MKMSNMKVIEKFIEGNGKNVQSHTGNLFVSSDEKRLFNYKTVIAKIDTEKNVIYVNTTKYSVTTSKIQTYLKRELATSDLEVIFVTHKELN